MEFFNKKEEVLDIQLTSYGKAVFRKTEEAVKKDESDEKQLNLKKKSLSFDFNPVLVFMAYEKLLPNPFI